MRQALRTMCVLTALGVAVPALAQVQEGTVASTPQAQTVPRYEVGRARPPVVEGMKLLELTLAEAQALALEKNLDLKSARMNPISMDYQLQAARAAYRTSISGSYGYSNSTSPSNNTLDGVSSVTSIGQNFNGSFSKPLPWYGASLSGSWSNSRSSTNNVTARLNPSYSAGTQLSFSMPLLANFKIDGTRNTLRTLPIQREITDIQLLAQIENIKNSVRTSYWNLRSTIEQIEIARLQLAQARKNHEDSLLRVQIGTMASIEVITFENQVISAEQSVLAAEISWRTSELNFKRLLVSGTDDELYSRTTINPVDRPELSLQTVDIQAAVTRALADRTDIIVARKNLEVSRFGLEVTKQSLLPTLSLSAGYSLSGQGGTQRIGNTIIPGGWGDALRAIGGFDAPRWNVGLNFSYPLGKTQERANVARAEISLEQSQTQLKLQELTISTQVINAGMNVENAYRLYQGAIRSREASERNAEAARIRYDNGLLTNFDVVNAENALQSARLQELSRLIAYMNAVAEFDRVQRIN